MLHKRKEEAVLVWGSKHAFESSTKLQLCMTGSYYCPMLSNGNAWGAVCWYERFVHKGSVPVITVRLIKTSQQACQFFSSLCGRGALQFLAFEWLLAVESITRGFSLPSWVV
jgi:hypothetical protein